jgi:hypothetical protein
MTKPSFWVGIQPNPKFKQNPRAKRKILALFAVIKRGRKRFYFSNIVETNIAVKLYIV